MGEGEEKSYIAVSTPGHGMEHAIVPRLSGLDIRKGLGYHEQNITILHVATF